MEREDDPQLWELLGHSKVPEASPFFSRNVLRAVRNQRPTWGGFAGWLQLRWLIPGASAVAALVVAVFTLHSMRDQQPPQPVSHVVPQPAPHLVPQPSAEPVLVADAVLATDLDVLTGEDDGDDMPLL